jgi:hypothetical protein
MLLLQTSVGLLKSPETLNDVFKLLKLISVFFLHSLQECFIVLQLLHLLLNDHRLVLKLFQFLFFLTYLLQLFSDLFSYLNGSL